ncbi:TPA: DUF1983 domain-containing protein [Klebsiella pneumoniae]|nr:DUF1983 domain-containing protein [Klebsiella pneumoniae]
MKLQQQSIKDGDAALSQEIKKAQSSLTTSLSQTSKDLTAAIQKETNDRIADVNDAAKKAADQLLSAKNELKTSIDSLSEVVTSGDENLARQISQIAAGTGEQFDSLKIWYFDQDAEGWTEDDNGYTPMSVTSDGWLKANNPTSTCRSPNGLTIDAHAYRFIKMRVKKVGNPTWNARMFWIGADETGWNAGRSVVINEPEYDDKGIAILTLHDIEWRDSTTIRRFRFDFTSGQDADNYLLFDWIAVGRPTPGAGMAALQEEQQARANADTAEAQARSTLAAQIRGSSESGNLDDIRSGLIYQEKNARITADAAEASARESLQTEFNRNKASVAEELHTLSTEQTSQASKITGLQTSLGQKADASAVQTISQKVEEQGNTLKSQGAALSTLDNRVGSVESGVSANSKAITGLQSTVIQQDKTLSSQSESITTLNNSLSDIQSDTDTAKSNPSNLLVNASFERDLAGWSAGNSVSSIIKASAPHSGSKILVCAAGTVQITQSVSVVEGRTYKLSSFVRCTTDAVISSPGNNKLRIGAATLLKEIPIRPENLPKDETWKEVSDTWKATLTGKVDVSIMSSLKTGSQYFDDVGFVDVTDALAIEANASATNALTSRVSSVEGTITSQGQQITSMQNSIKNKADASAVTNLTNRVTAAENQISSQSQSITSLSNSLDNANADADASKAIVGNMLKNNSFERGFEGWEYVGWTLLEAQNPKSGKYIIQAGKLASGGDSGCNQTVELQAGKTYRIGAWVRKSADFAINNAGNNKISLRNADLTPLKDIPITGAGLSTNWALISGEYTPAKTASVVVSLRASVASGYMYLDDVFCVDVSNEKAIDATSNALSTLNSTVTQQGKDITSNSNSITSLSNQMVNGRQNMWVRSVYNVQLANNTTEPTFSDINGKAPISIDEVPDAAKLDFASAGSYVIAHYKAFVKVNADTTITMAPGSRVFDDTGAVYVNGVRVAFGNASWNTVSFDLKAGWSTVEFLVNQWTGQAYINLGFKLSEKVAQLNSALGMNALSNAISAVTSNVSTVGDRVTSTSQSVTDLRNSLEQTNANLANKADAQALSTLQNTVSKQGDTISSQGNSITNLNNTLTAARNAGDNLIPNYDFLQGATAWDIQYPAGVTFGNFGDGKAGVKLNRTTTTSPGIFSNNNKPLPLNGQRKYRVVVKAKGVSGAMNMLIRRQNKIGQTDSNYEDKNVTLTSEWQTITWETGLTASNADGQNFKLYAHPANAEIWVDTFKVFDITDEVKIKANSDALSTLSSTVTQQGDKITSQGNSITKLTNDLEAADANIAKKADQSAVTTLTGRVEKTESGLTAANSNITSLSSSLNQQSKRGANLLPDGTFESYAVGHNLSNNRVIVTTDDSHGGSKCIRVTRPNDYNANATDNSDNHIFSGFQVRDNAVFYMECWVKLDAKSTAMAENAQISIGLSLQYQDNSWQWPAVTKAAKDLSSTQWTKVSGYLKSTKSGIKQAMVRISIPNVSSVKAGNSFLIDDLVITEVTDAYNAQSTADANANAISTLDSTVSQQGDQITSQGNSITKLTNDLATTNNNVSNKADANALTALTNRVTQTEKDINSTSSSVTNLNNKVDAISVGGTNLIKNSGDMAGWSNVVSDSYRGNAVIGATVKAGSGYRDLREITLESPVDAGEYVYSFYAKGGVAGQTMTAFFYNPNTTTSIETSQGAKGNNSDGRAQFTLTTSWARYWVKWKQTPTTGTKRLILCRIESNTSKDQTVYINSPKFEVGNVVSDWNESPSDSASASAVDSLTTKVNQQGTSISSIGNRTTSLENGLSTAQNNIARKADASALQDLRNTVTSQGGDLTAANSSITSLQASMNRRTVFTVTARGNGNSVTPGVFDESGKNLFTPGRSWALVTFAKHSDGSTVIATSKTYDVFGSANNGATMSADIEALASGTYVCVLTFDEPSGNRGKILSALESLGGTSEVVNSLPYRGAYILLGRKGMKPGDGLELRAPTGGDGTAHISTSVEFVNGVMMGLGAAGGVMMKADANASAITTLQNTVKNQGDNIDSLSSSTTALENSLASSNASVDAASQIPGNLIVNPSFERGTEGYTGWSGIATVVTLQVPHLGTKAAKLAAGGSAGVGQKISFKKDRSYKIGIWAKQDPNTTIQSTDNTKFRVAEGNGLIASKAYGPFTSNWQEVSWTWKATKDVVADVQFTAFLSAGAMYFDDFYVVDVTDSVETQANSSAITKLDSRVTKTENDITSQGSQVTQLKNDLATTNTNVSKKADAAALTALTNRVTQNEKEIETQSSQTTSLKNSLSTVQAMGSNPWFDGSLETYSENQQISGSRAVVVSSQKRSGTKSLRVSRGAGEGGNSDKSIGKWIALRENAVFRIELWAMMPADQSPSSGWSTIVGLQTQNAANNNNWPSAITITEGSLGGRGTWKKFTGTLRVATGHTRGVFWISTRGSTGAGTPGYDLYIDDVVVTDITDAKEAQDSANANASALTSLTSRVTNVEGQVTSQASQLSSLTSQVNDASSKVDQMAQTITNNEKTQSSLNTSLQSQIDAQASANIKNQTELNNATTSLAAIKSTQQTQATTISALSQQQTNLTAQVGGQSAELQELKKTVVENGNVNSTWMVKMETNSNGKKYAAGIALGIDGKNLQSQFLVQADRFGLINTSNGNTTTPFVVENGVAYMNAAVIKDGSITNAKIGGEIRSDNFVDGSQGWRVGKDGSSQFNNVIVRGTVYATDGRFDGTVYANRLEGDIGSFAINIAQHRSRKVPKATWQWFELLRIRRQNFDQIVHLKGSLLQSDRINVSGGGTLRAGMSYSSGSDGGLDPGYLSYAILLRGGGATSGGGSMELGIELMYETGGATRIVTAQESMSLENLTFVVPAGTGDAVLRYGCYLDRNGQMVLSILSRFDAFAARNNGVIRGASSD